MYSLNNQIKKMKNILIRDALTIQVYDLIKRV